MMRRRVLGLGAAQRGAVVIELALVAPVLALAIIGIVDISNAYTRKLALEQGAQRAIEKIMQTTQQTTVEGTLTNEAVCQVNGMNPDGTCKTSPITAANVTVTWTLECTDGGGTVTIQQATDSTIFDSLTCGSGTVKQARYVRVSVTDQYTPIFPIHFASFTDADGTYHLSATAGMRTQ